MKYKLFTDCKDLEGVRTTRDLLYIELLSYHLKKLCGWPRKESTNIFRYLLDRHAFIATVAVFVPQMLYLKNHIGKLPLLQMAHTYITSLMSVVSLSRLQLAAFSQQYRQFNFDFMEKYHVFNHRHRSEYAMKTHILVHKISHFLTVYLVYMMSCGITMFNLMPLYNNIMSGSFNSNSTVPFEHSVYFTLPFNYETNIYGYLVLFTANWYLAYICTASFCTYDTYITMVVIHLWGHIRIIINKIENFPKPKRFFNLQTFLETGFYSEEEQYKVTRHLVDIILHHQIIIDFYNEINETFGGVLLIYYAFYQIICCLLLLQCSLLEIEALTKFGLLTFFFYEQLILTSVNFEYVGTMGDKLQTSMYLLPWEGMNTSNRKIIWILLRKSQESLNLKAMSMLGIGVQTMATILKTSLSYFILLKSIAANDR